MFIKNNCIRGEMLGLAMFGGKRDIVILVILQIILGSVYLGSVPRIYVDEVWDSSIGYNLACQGTLKHPFVEGFGGMEVHFVQSRVVLPLVCAAIFKVAGYSIVASRIGSVLFGVLAVVSLYAVMCRWFGREAGILHRIGNHHSSVVFRSEQACPAGNLLHSTGVSVFMVNGGFF